MPALVVFRWRVQSQLRHTAWAHEKREGQRERDAGVGKMSVKSSRQMLHWSRVGGAAGTGGRAGPHVRFGLQCCAMAAARSIQACWWVAAERVSGRRAAVVSHSRRTAR